MIKKIVYGCILVCLISLGFTKKDSSVPDTGFAVVELFTSEGCSSCPPADVLIAKIDREYKNRPVYILAYHVDYWNRLGWKDKFSDARYSARQRQYANWLSLNSVYTPQIVVNGAREFIGSEERTLRSAIQHALANKATHSLQISIAKQTGNNLTLNYTTDLKASDYELVVATINPNSVSKIGNGENKGKTLSHVQIVSDYKKFSLNGKTSGHINLTAKGSATKPLNPIEIIAFLQNSKTGKIIAAARATDKLKK